jgi:hypothetical protein
MPNYFQERAKKIIGKRVVIGISYYDHEGVFIELKQMHGTIVRANTRNGVAVELEGIRKGEIFWLPPDLKAFKKAKRRIYKARSTAEVIEYPDLISTWKVAKPAPDQLKNHKQRNRALFSPYSRP